jgi:hypothetical protein
MRSSSNFILSICILFVAAWALSADDYLTKNGKLTHTLKITQLQGGFAGLTGNEYTIQPDGTWTITSLFKQKATQKGRGKLTAKALENLAAILSKNGLEKLPQKLGKSPGANPFTVMIEYGKHKTTYVGQSAPKLDTVLPTVESRIAGIYQGVVGMLKGHEIKKAPSE